MRQIAAFVLVLLLLSATGHAYTETDGNFASWTFSEMSWGPASSDEGEGSVIPNGSGGSMVTILTSTYHGTSIHVIGLKNDFEWNPADMGAIESVNMSIENLFVSSSGGARNQSVELIVFQDGNYYYRKIADAEYNTDWTLNEGLPLENDDFYLMRPGVGDDPTVNPDFSATGAPIKFGFSAAARISQVNVHNYDNYTLTINAVPVPGSFFLLSSGLAGVFGIRRRQSS